LLTIRAAIHGAILRQTVSPKQPFGSERRVHRRHSANGLPWRSNHLGALASGGALL
jgi:hypothetical protein